MKNILISILVFVLNFVILGYIVCNMVLFSGVTGNEYIFKMIIAIVFDLIMSIIVTAGKESIKNFLLGE